MLQNKLSKKAFWDVDMQQLDAHTHAQFIIEKVFEHGTLDDIKIVINHYGKEKIAQALIHSNYLFKDTLQFASALLKIPKEDFKCYTKIQSQKNAGIYLKR